MKLLASKTLDRNVGDEEEDMAAVEESIDNSTPQGSAYVELLQTINQQAHTGTVKCTNDCLLALELILYNYSLFNVTNVYNYVTHN